MCVACGILGRGQSRNAEQMIGQGKGTEWHLRRAWDSIYGTLAKKVGLRWSTGYPLLRITCGAKSFREEQSKRASLGSWGSPLPTALEVEPTNVMVDCSTDNLRDEMP